MKNPLVEVKNLGKAFPYYTYEWQRVTKWFGLPIKPKSWRWILKDLSFEIKAGESIGIIGNNGAGKSTLLKMLTGTLQPTEGTVKSTGTVAAILELGMGFNFELTARQNIYFAAQLMGFTREEVDDLLPEIADFCEMGDYFDNPMRTYSSGMQIRVAFAVATAKRPDLLIVDEALSVGDTYFQHKSYQKIRSFQEKGTTLLFVSHDKTAVQGHCQRVILLNNGNIAQDGNPEEVFDYYNALLADREAKTIVVTPLKNGKKQISSGTGEAKIQEITLLNQAGDTVEVLRVGEKVKLNVKVKILQSIASLVLGLGIKDRLGQVLFGTNTWYTGHMLENLEVGSEYIYSFEWIVNLGVGDYSMNFALTDLNTHLSKNYEWLDMALLFQVINAGKYHFIGTSWLDMDVKTSVLQQNTNLILEGVIKTAVNHF